MMRPGRCYDLGTMTSKILCGLAFAWGDITDFDPDFLDEMKARAAAEGE